MCKYACVNHTSIDNRGESMWAGENPQMHTVEVRMLLQRIDTSVWSQLTPQIQVYNGSVPVHCILHLPNPLCHSIHVLWYHVLSCVDLRVQISQDNLRNSFPHIHMQRYQRTTRYQSLYQRIPVHQSNFDSPVTSLDCQLSTQPPLCQSIPVHQSNSDSPGISRSRDYQLSTQPPLCQ